MRTAASTTFAVSGESGQRLGSHVVETNGQALVEQLRTIPGKRHVVLEEGTQSAWIYEILSPHADEVLVMMIPESRGQKSDESDAFKLAEQLRTGGIKRHVFKEVGEYRTLRELARTHAMVVQDVVRVQNRIKALLRSRGVTASRAGARGRGAGDADADADAAHGFGLAAWAGGFGVTRGRHDERGAKTPW
jgi:hypothetical protein